MDNTDLITGLPIVKNLGPETMTVQQLILKLQQLPENWKVFGVINDEQFEITNCFVIDENEIGLTLKV